MRKEILTHGLFLLIFFVLVTLFRHYFELNLAAILKYGPFWLGGILGTILPDLDHFIYVYFLAPQELTSQRVNYTLANPATSPQKRIWDTFELLASTREERKSLIFHSVHFQVIFWVLTFLVISSSGSIFGRGLVLAFALHLLVDGLIDLLKIGNLDTWFNQWKIVLTKEKYLFYWLGNALVLLLFSFIL